VIGHIGVNVSDLDRARSYYSALMPLPEFETYLDDPDQVTYRPAEGKPGTSFFLYPATTSVPYARANVGLQHLAFMVRTRSGVDRVHELVTQLGSEVVEAVCHHDRD
jgi:catechol 2,3-dioxygenase-like lactoylglutathione lyase family enzyme